MSGLTRRGSAAGALGFGRAAAQQPWPNRTVRLVLPFAAGGAADVVIRIVAAAISDSTGQSFVVENRTGGSGNIGTEAVARSTQDGTTFGRLARHAGDQPAYVCPAAL